MTKNIKTEQGRSMVEMLGTLAIIGVLSVGGIAGYTYAMNRYYTNELLAGASERVVLVSAQLASGREPNLNEFAHYPEIGGKFDSKVEEWDGEFGIKVSKVKESVCKNLINATQDTDIVLANVSGTDLTETDCSGDNNEFYFAFKTGIGGTTTETDPLCADVECDSGLTCVNGSCLCSDRMLPCNGLCCEKGQVCSAPVNSEYAECATPTGGECATNSDCDPGEFCLFGSYTSSSVSGTTCDMPTNGVCTPLTGSYAKKMVEDSDEPLYGMTYSDTTMNWGSASNWCQANGGRLITWATLNTLSGEDSNAARKTTLRGGLNEPSSDYVWLGDADSSTPCNARYVYFGSIKPYPLPDFLPNEAPYLVLCE